MITKFRLPSGMLIVMIACNPHAENAAVRQELVTKGVEIKVTEFREREIQKCHDRALAIALYEADSILRSVARREAVDPVLKPPKPERPVKPEIKTLPDTLRREEG